MDRHPTDADAQATRRSACKRPSRAQRHLLGPAFRCTVARPTVVVSEELIEKAEEEEAGML